MAAWVKVAKAMVQVEWPDFELINSFGVFQARDNVHSEAEQRLMLERLAAPLLMDGRAFSHEEKENLMIHLWRQYQTCKPFAFKVASRLTGSPDKAFLCWIESVRKARNNGHDVRSLQTLVHAGLASVGASTSNCERDFAALRERSNSTVAEVERFLQEFMSSMKSGPQAMERKKALCQAARRVWKIGFGKPRASGKRRKSFNWINGLRKKQTKAA
jgi:hypothetical protein